MSQKKVPELPVGLRVTDWLSVRRNVQPRSQWTARIAWIVEEKQASPVG